MSTLNELTAARDDLNRRIADAAAQELANDLHRQLGDEGFTIAPDAYRAHVRFDAADDGGEFPFAFLRMVPLADGADADEFADAAEVLEQEFQGYATFHEWAGALTALHSDLHEFDFVLPAAETTPTGPNANVLFPYGRCDSCGNGIDVTGSCATGGCSAFPYDGVCDECAAPFTTTPEGTNLHADTHGSEGPDLDADHVAYQTPDDDGEDFEFAISGRRRSIREVVGASMLSKGHAARQAADVIGAINTEVADLDLGEDVHPVVSAVLHFDDSLRGDELAPRPVLFTGNDTLDEVVNDSPDVVGHALGSLVIRLVNVYGGPGRLWGKWFRIDSDGTVSPHLPENQAEAEVEDAPGGAAGRARAEVEWAARSDKAHKAAITAVVLLRPDLNRRQAAEWLRTSHRVNWSPSNDPAYAVADAYSSDRQTQATLYAVTALAARLGLDDGLLSDVNPWDGAAWVASGAVVLHLADGRTLWTGMVTTNDDTGETSGGFATAALFDADGQVQTTGIDTGLPLRCADPLRVAKALVKVIRNLPAAG